MNYIFDGQPHPIAESDFAYIIQKIDSTKGISELEKVKQSLFETYVKYLMKNDPESCVSILARYFMYEYESLDIQCVYRPSWMMSCVSQEALMSLKFKRKENDDLGEQID